ncbi:MAG: HPr kinase/phosphatase C-terminal domain-containing protein [Silicimonas sp.]|jgi:HPr kinase/phosphorylase|nr:HPr kinase/phosphatase C-terminal domain-containing protein [Silicimonas sp.]
MPGPHHASAVAFDGRGVLLTGPSGSGKSMLALELIALGAVLVADDGVILSNRDGGLWMEAPMPISGRIEARGLGILATHAAPAFAALVVDMAEVETARMPERREITLEDVTLPLLRRVESPAFASMLRVYLSTGKAE